MVAAVTGRPPMVTPGRPTPTGISGTSSPALARRLTSRPIAALTGPAWTGSVWGMRRGSEASWPCGVHERGLDAAAADIDPDREPSVGHVTPQK